MMNDFACAVVEAAHQPRRGPDLDAARQRARQRQRGRYSGLAASFAIVAATTFAVARWNENGNRPKVQVATSAETWQTFTSPGGDLQIRYPADWNVAAEVLTPHLTDPREVLALGTFPMQPADHNCAHIPVNALEQMGGTDGFIWITERIGADQMPAPNFGPRPTPFGPTTGTDANGGDLAACLNHPLLGTARAISFDDHGRLFTIDYAIGADASRQRRADIFTILNSFTIN
jgi:hypothetical protein